MNNSSPVVLDNASDTLIIHLKKEGFADFVKGLLGQPQTIENLYSWAFDIGYKEIEDLHHLIDQRIRQQNGGHLIEFSSKIIYDDKTSVRLDSLMAFQAYRQIGSKFPTRVILTWSYLIQFNDRPAPELQTIEVSAFVGNSGDDGYRISGGLYRSFFPNSGFRLLIQHTARTWANDIENLIGNQLKEWKKPENWFLRVLYENVGWVGFITGIIFLSLFLSGVYVVAERMAAEINNAALQASVLQSEEALKYLISQVAKLRTSGTNVIGIVGLISGFIGALFVGIIAAGFAGNPPKSYLIFSDEAKIAKIRSERRRAKGFTYFFVTFLVSTAAGYCSKYLFAITVGIPHL